MAHNSTYRIYFWAKPLTILLQTLGAVTGPALIIALFLYSVSEGGQINIYIILLGLGSMLFLFFGFFYFLGRMAEILPNIYHRFEGIANFDRSGYYPGATMVFSYTDRLAYRQPERPVAVTLKYAEFETNGALDPIERDTLYTQTLNTTAYQLSTGLTIQIPAHSDQLNLSRSYPDRLQRIWHVVVRDSVDGFSQTFSPGILPEPGVKV